MSNKTLWKQIKPAEKITLCALVILAVLTTLIHLTAKPCDYVEQPPDAGPEYEPIIYDIAPPQEEIEVEKEIFLLTAYCPCYECSEGYGNMTATGRQAIEGRTIAVDPNVIEYGTEVCIDGKMYIAEDCGGLVKGKHIDIYFDSHDKVDAFGKKYAEVEI
jgi:3D (Asp-Asp-Asp) domain-containing protein